MPAHLNRQPNRIIICLALAALLGVGLWLRLRFLNTAQLYPDEFVTLLAVRMIGSVGLPVLPSGLFYDHGLLFSYAGSLAALLGPARLTVRYTSLFFGMLTLALTFSMGRRWFSAGVGLMAVAGLTVAPAAIQWSGRARMYALLQLLVLLTLWLAYEGIVHDKTRWRWAALLAYLGATLTHFNAVALAPPLLLAGVLLWWLKAWAGVQEDRPAGRTLLEIARQRRLWLEVMALGGILLIAFYVKRAGQPKGIEALDAGNAVSGLAQVLSIYGNLSLNVIEGWQAISPFFLTLPASIFALFALLAMVISLAQLFNRSGRRSTAASMAAGSTEELVAEPNPIPRQGRLPALFLSVMLLATTLEMIFLVSPERRDDKYLFMLLPALLLLGAYGMELATRYLLAAVGSRPKSKFAHNLHSVVIPLIISGLILTMTGPAVRMLLSNTGDDYDTAFAYVISHWRPGDMILTGTPAAAAFYLGHNDFYSVQRSGGYDYRVLTVDNQVVDRWLGSPAVRDEAALHQTLADHNVWLVLERWGVQREYYDPLFQQQLLAQTDLIPEVGAQGILVMRSKTDPRPVKPDPAHSTEANFGNQVQLTGFTVEPAEPSPGQPLRLTLYWQPLTPMPADYTVFVHLRQPAGGSNVAQADHLPLGSIYPTSMWPVGETIRETNDLFLPLELAPGNYELWVGLYLLDTGERLLVQNDSSGENAVKLGELVVE